MDRHAAWLEHRVAQAADAWLTDPQDAAVYARLVTAIRERRAYLQPRLDQTPPGQEQLLDPPAAVRIGDLLGSEDPRAVRTSLLNSDSPGTSLRRSGTPPTADTAGEPPPPTSPRSGNQRTGPEVRPLPDLFPGPA